MGSISAEIPTLWSKIPTFYIILELNLKKKNHYLNMSKNIITHTLNFHSHLECRSLSICHAKSIHLKVWLFHSVYKLNCLNYSHRDLKGTSSIPVTYQGVTSGRWDMHSDLLQASLQSRFCAEDDHIQGYGKESVMCECPPGTQDNLNAKHSLHTIKL
jgi:hypothetical protein